jgi:hypothetical protein
MCRLPSVASRLSFVVSENIVQTKKQAHDSIKKLPVKSEADCILQTE